jgi:Flp pilus assembly protein TadB
MSGTVLLVVSVVALVCGFFYWRKNKEKVRSRLDNAIDKFK